MLGKFLKSNGSESLRSLLDDAPRPGDFEIGSSASRAAARALLEAKKSGKQNTNRVVVDCVGKGQVLKEASGKPRGATCQRRLCDDGQVFEFVDLCASELSEKEAEALISRVPVDGKTYNLEEFRTKPDNAQLRRGL